MSVGDLGGVRILAATGAQVSADSLAVVPASDWGPGWRRPYDARGQVSAAGGVLATFTLPATPGRRWVVDVAAWGLATTGASALLNARILDGAATVWNEPIAVAAVAGAIDRVVLGPGSGIMGSVGNAVTVTFDLAGAATVYERLSYGAYLV